MASQSKPESDPESVAPENTAPEEHLPRRFGPSQSQRWVTASGLVSFLLVSGIDYADGVAVGEWSALTVDTTVVIGLVLATFDVFRKEVLVGEEEIREVRPLWRDRSLQISEIQRVHVPTTQGGLWLYTDPDGNPALKIGSGLEASDEFEEVVIQSVPPEARITGLGRKGRAHRVTVA